jgi:hypothetical protein
MEKLFRQGRIAKMPVQVMTLKPKTEEERKLKLRCHFHPNWQMQCELKPLFLLSANANILFTFELLSL